MLTELKDALDIFDHSDERMTAAQWTLILDAARDVANGKQIWWCERHNASGESQACYKAASMSSGAVSLIGPATLDCHMVAALGITTEDTEGRWCITHNKYRGHDGANQGCRIITEDATK